MDASASTELVADDANLGSKTANNTGSADDSASILDKLIQDMAESEAAASDAEELRDWIKSTVNDDTRKSLNMKDEGGQTILHFAARHGLAQAVKQLINAEADLNARDKSGTTPLIHACWGKHPNIVEILIETGANTQIFDNDDWSALYLAATLGYAEIFHLLVERHEWDVNFPEKLCGKTPLHAAVAGSDKTIVRYLRNKGARLDIRDSEGRTPLMLATMFRKEDITEELLKPRNGEDLQLETEDVHERTPLSIAAEMGFLAIARLLFQAGAKCDQFETSKTTKTDQVPVTNLKKNTALHYAVWENQSEMTEFLLDSGADVNAWNHEGQQPLHLASRRGNPAILKLLLDSGRCNHLNNLDDDGMTPLHLASCVDDEDGQKKINPNPEAGSQTDQEATRANSQSELRPHIKVIRLLLSKQADTKMLTNDGKTAVELAFSSGHQDRGEEILNLFLEAKGGIGVTLEWAAAGTERHQIAISLIKKQLKESGSTITDKSKDWHAIEWAVHGATDPRVLWLLIASSPQSKETKQALESAKKIVDGKLPKMQTEKMVTQSGAQKHDQTGNMKKGDKSLEEMQDFIHNPPTGLICTDSKSYSAPKLKSAISSLEEYKASIVHFYKKEGQFDSIIRFGTIKEAIYSYGPQNIMDKVVRKLRSASSSHLESLDRKAAQTVTRPIFLDSKPDFTWVHLPATNMVWMNDLMQRIMKDEDRPIDHFNQAKSFFEDSWIEVPEKTSMSRMMRPRFVSLNTTSRDRKDTEIPTQDAGRIPKANPDEKRESDEEGNADVKVGDGEGRNASTGQRQRETDDKQAVTAPAVTATAIYMPYFSYSFQSMDKKVESSQSPKRRGNERTSTEESTTGRHSVGVQESRRPEHELGQHPEKKSEQDQELDYTNTLAKARKKYHTLLREYKENTVHGSSTLDESYYHFDDDPESLHDKDRRNTSQVATRFWREDKQRKKQARLGREQQEQEQQEQERYWLLIRVNQLWIWTINDKWLISASSHSIDDGEDELLNGIRDRLEKQGKAGGSHLQPASTTDMSRLIVDYCVDSYDRKPEPHGDGRPEDCRLDKFLSIRQTFSKSINSIARDETNLFEQFSSLTKELRTMSRDDTRRHSKTAKAMDKKLANATIKAEELSNSVKDILDELSILEATVQYQQDVQRAMRKKTSTGKQDFLDTDLTATYIINDIKGLGSVANRVHTAVNTTISLQLSEVANLQAKLSIEHAELATQQGRVLMVFTVVTILFLPMSFLSSLFALDVASFEQAPAWALILIFSISTAFFVPTVIVAFTVKRSKQFISGLLSALINKVMAFICYLLERAETLTLTGAKGDGGRAKPNLGRSETPPQAVPQRIRGSITSLRASEGGDGRDLEMAWGVGSGAARDPEEPSRSIVRRSGEIVPE